MKTDKVYILIVTLLLMGLVFSSSINASIDGTSKWVSEIVRNRVTILNDNNHLPIYINGNENFTSQNGVTDGSGTDDDPYIIEDWVIVGNGSTSEGIFINNTYAYFVIRNCTISNLTNTYDSGILFNHVENGRIENTISFRTQKAIKVQKSCRIEIFNCTSDSYSSVWFASGVSCYDSYYITISSCDFYGKGFSVSLFDTSYSVIDNSSCYNNSFFGVYISGKQSEHNIVKDCKIYNNYHEGIRLSADDNERHSTYTHILRCDIYNNGLLPDADNGEPGIRIWNVHENIIEDCNICHNGRGVKIDASRGNIIRNCNIFDHYKDSGFLAEGIVISRDYIGLIRSRNNKVINCDIYNNEIGISTYGTLLIKIEKNNVYNNSYLGIASVRSFLNHINYNNFIDNGEFKVALDSGGVCSRVSFINARNNWWGSPLGPSRLLPLRGDYIKTILGICTSHPWSKEPIPDAGVQ